MSIEFSRRSLLGAGLGAGIAATIGVPAAQAAVKDYVYQKQQTSYWCSAAAARIALSHELRYVRGRALPTQESLARGLDLEPNGGPSTAGLKDPYRIAAVLNNRIGIENKPERYVFRQPNDLAPTLRKHVRHSINAGFPVVVNVDQVDNDHYAGHYITIVGYGDESYKIADPANPSRNGVWRQKSTVVSWIKHGRYTAYGLA